MEPWYKVATPRKEVREGRSFNPNEFAIALEQVVVRTAPEDYRDPAQFFARTFFTRALREQAGMVLRRLSGKTENTAPVLTLITQFGGGKTHTLTTLYHLATNGDAAVGYNGVAARATSLNSTGNGRPENFARGAGAEFELATPCASAARGANAASQHRPGMSRPRTTSRGGRVCAKREKRIQSGNESSAIG